MANQRVAWELEITGLDDSDTFYAESLIHVLEGHRVQIVKHDAKNKPAYFLQIPSDADDDLYLAVKQGRESITWINGIAKLFYPRHPSLDVKTSSAFEIMNDGGREPYLGALVECQVSFKGGEPKLTDEELNQFRQITLAVLSLKASLGKKAKPEQADVAEGQSCKLDTAATSTLLTIHKDLGNLLNMLCRNFELRVELRDVYTAVQIAGRIRKLTGVYSREKVDTEEIEEIEHRLYKRLCSTSSHYGLQGTRSRHGGRDLTKEKNFNPSTDGINPAEAQTYLHLYVKRTLALLVRKFQCEPCETQLLAETEEKLKKIRRTCEAALVYRLKMVVE
jgi:hypothetical protein